MRIPIFCGSVEIERCDPIRARQLAMAPNATARLRGKAIVSIQLHAYAASADHHRARRPHAVAAAEDSQSTFRQALDAGDALVTGYLLQHKRRDPQWPAVVAEEMAEVMAV